MSRLSRRTLLPLAAIGVLLLVGLYFAYRAQAASSISNVGNTVATSVGPIDAVPYPVADGDYVIVGVTPANNTIPQVPSGWQNLLQGGSNSGQKVWVFVRFVPAGGFTTPQIFESNDGADLTVVSGAYRGVDPTQPVTKSFAGGGTGSILIRNEVISESAVMLVSHSLAADIIPIDPAGLTREESTITKPSSMIASTVDSGPGGNDFFINIDPTSGATGHYAYAVLDLNPDASASQTVDIGVFDNVAGDALTAGGTPGLAGNDYIEARADFYLDDGDGLPGAGDILSASSTGSDGRWNTDLVDGTYWVVVTPTDETAPAWREQTYGPAGSWCDDGTGTATQLASAGPCYGGKTHDQSHDDSALAGAEHLAQFTMAGAGATLDFGFSYNVVTNTGDTDQDATSTRFAQGTLRQFIDNANQVAGPNTMRFVPLAAPELRGETWQIIANTPLPPITGDSTVLSGDRYGPAGLQIIGAALISIPDPGSLLGSPVQFLLAPPLEIEGSLSFQGTASSALQNVSVYNPGGVAIHLDNATAYTIDNVFAGIDAVEAPSAPATSFGIQSFGSDGTIDHLLAAQNSENGISIDSTGGTTLLNNSWIHDNGTSGVGGTGVLTESDLTITDTSIDGNVGDGVVIGDPALVVLRGSTSFGNGENGQGSGVLVLSDDAVIDDSAINNNSDVGVRVGPDARNVEISGSTFSQNGNIAIDLLEQTATGNTVTLNDDGDPDIGANDLLNAPAITAATVSGGNLTVSGFAPAGSTVTVYVTGGDLIGFGEGNKIVGSFVEGSADDNDTNVASYSTISGAETSANQFSFTMPDTSSGIPKVSAIAHVAGVGTSEFSNNEAIVAVEGTISTRVFEDIVGDGLADGAIGSTNNPFIGADVTIYRDDGNGVPGLEDTWVTAGTTGAAGFDVAGLEYDEYWVIVDSNPLDGSVAPVWLEQTYGPAGGLCADGNGGSTSRTTAGLCYGGRRAGQSDSPGQDIANVEHVAFVDLDSESVSLDFGFSRNVVTHADDTDHRTNSQWFSQGSFRQFILNANDDISLSEMRFVPVVATNASSGSQDWWMVDVSSTLPTIVHPTTIDGTAYDFVDGTGQKAQVPVVQSPDVGSNDIALSPYLGPSLELAGGNLDFDGAPNSTVANISVHRSSTPAVRITDSINTLILGAFLGAAPDGQAPSQNVGGIGLEATNSAGGSIEHSLISHNTDAGATLTSSSLWTIRNTTIEFNGTGDDTDVGLALDRSATLNQNFISRNDATGIHLAPGSYSATIEDSSFVGDPAGGVDHAALLIENDQSLISGTEFVDNTGGAIRVSSIGSAALIDTDTFFEGNGTAAIDLLRPSADQTYGTTPWTTLNDDLDIDTGGNGLLNKPVIDTVTTNREPQK